MPSPAISKIMDSRGPRQNHANLSIARSCLLCVSRIMCAFVYVCVCVRKKRTEEKGKFGTTGKKGEEKDCPSQDAQTGCLGAHMGVLENCCLPRSVPAHHATGQDAPQPRGLKGVGSTLFRSPCQRSGCVKVHRTGTSLPILCCDACNRESCSLSTTSCRWYDASPQPSAGCRVT